RRKHTDKVESFARPRINLCRSRSWLFIIKRSRHPHETCQICHDSVIASQTVSKYRCLESFSKLFPNLWMERSIAEPKWLEATSRADNCARIRNPGRIAEGFNGTRRLCKVGVALRTRFNINVGEECVEGQRVGAACTCYYGQLCAPFVRTCRSRCPSPGVTLTAT